MRQNCEIVVAVQEGRPVTEDELKLALLSYALCASNQHRKLRELKEVAEKTPNLLAMHVKLRATDEYWPMIKASPATWLGPRNTPGTPEFEQAQKWAKDVFEKATGVKL